MKKLGGKMKKIFLFVILLLVTSCGGAPESQKTFESVMKSLQSGDSKEIVKTMKDDIGFENAENSFSTMSFYSEHFKKVKSTPSGGVQKLRKVRIRELN